MIELIQVPYSPYCIVQRRILEYSGAPFRLKNVPNGDRSLVWKLTRGRYYQVPVLKDGHQVLFETEADSQVIAKYLDEKLNLGLFPDAWAGIQDLIWRYIENDVEGIGFKLNDIHWKENVPPADRLAFVRHKERKFGRGCLEQWKQEEKALLRQFSDALLPFEKMLLSHPFLLDERPRFLDFDLYGIVGNVLYTGHYKIPTRHVRIRDWHHRMTRLRHLR